MTALMVESPRARMCPWAKSGAINSAERSGVWGGQRHRGRMGASLALGTPYYGLKSVGGQVVLDPEAFPCCQGHGQRVRQAERGILSPHSAPFFSSAACTILRCSLIERWQKSSAVLSAYSRAFGFGVGSSEKNAVVSGAEVDIDIWREREIVKRAHRWLWVVDSPAPSLESSNRSQSSPDYYGRRGLKVLEYSGIDMWALSLVLGWSGNMRTHMISLGHTQDVSAWQGVEGCDVVVVRGTDHLASEQHRYLFERIVLQCYHYQKPLWVLERNLQEKNGSLSKAGPGGGSMRGERNMKGYVEELRRRGVRSFLSSSSNWKLSEVCKME